MQFLESIKSKTTKDKNGENMPHLGITEVVLVHCKNCKQLLSTRLKILVYIFFPTNRLVNY